VPPYLLGVALREGLPRIRARHIRWLWQPHSAGASARGGTIVGGLCGALVLGGLRVPLVRLADDRGPLCDVLSNAHFGRGAQAAQDRLPLVLGELLQRFAVVVAEIGDDVGYKPAEEALEEE